MCDDGLVPHLAPATRWVDCRSGPPVTLTDREPAPETTEVGSVTEAEMINLLAAAMIERGWTVVVPVGVAPMTPMTPTAAATELVRAMLLGAVSTDLRGE